MDNLEQQIEARLKELSDDELNKLAIHLKVPRAHEGIQAPLRVKISDLQRKNFGKWIKATGNIQKTGVYLGIIGESALPNEEISNTKGNNQELGHDSIKTRKPWYKTIWAIVAGLIIFLAALTTLILNLDKIKEKIPQNDFNKTIIETKSDKKDENIFSLSPKEIFEEIDSRPVFQRKDARKHYVGLKVKWRLHLSSVTKWNEKTVEVHMYDMQVLSPSISCVVEISRYPQLKVAKENSVIWVSGEISQIHELGIHLSNVSLEFE